MSLEVLPQARGGEKDKVKLTNSILKTNSLSKTLRLIVKSLLFIVVKRNFCLKLIS